MVEIDGITVTDDTIYVGMLADLSGRFATLVKDIVDGELAVFAEYNDRTGGVGGQYEIVALVEDTSRKPTQIAQQEVLRDLVQFTIPEPKSKERSKPEPRYRSWRRRVLSLSLRRGTAAVTCSSSRALHLRRLPASEG